MKTHRIVFLVGMMAGCTAVVGCAGTQPTVAREAPPGVHVVDRDYVNGVERVARQRGIKVSWVNVPDRRSD